MESGSGPAARTPTRRLTSRRAKINTSDPDSRRLKAPQGYLQGYNAQAAVTDNQIVIAAEVNADDRRFRPPRADGRRHPRRARGGRRHRQARGGGRRRRLLALRADGRDRGPRDPGDRAPRRGRAKDPEAGLGRRPLRVHAQGARNRGRRRALPKTPRDDRTRLRRHEVQPPHRPLLTPRTGRRQVGMAAHHRNPQPDEAPPPPNRPRPAERSPGATRTNNSSPPRAGPRADQKRIRRRFTQRPLAEGVARHLATCGPLVRGGGGKDSRPSDSNPT